ncbi:unnamed protein product [Rangifer tarandus platyrhynchus]|uniref:Uncharacterized protein n=1 Tax=Rangifer tarandus platyrhynchus TaxID=3082113 RepID=A0ABN8Z0W2_RANTA|nr:unnamed protein product [Rangifer tarandus platyrhynchus]
MPSGPAGLVLVGHRSAHAPAQECTCADFPLGDCVGDARHLLANVCIPGASRPCDLPWAEPDGRPGHQPISCKGRLVAPLAALGLRAVGPPSGHLGPDGREWSAAVVGPGIVSGVSEPRPGRQLGSGRGLPGLPAAGTGCGPWADVFTECLRQEVPAAGSRRLWPGRASGGSEGRDVTRPRPVGGAGRTPGSRRSLPGQLSARTCGPPPAALCLNLVGTICTWFSLLNSVDFSEPSATCGPRRSPRRGAAALLTPQPCL